MTSSTGVRTKIKNWASISICISTLNLFSIFVFIRYLFLYTFLVFLQFIDCLIRDKFLHREEGIFRIIDLWETTQCYRSWWNLLCAVVWDDCPLFWWSFTSTNTTKMSNDSHDNNVTLVHCIILRSLRTKTKRFRNSFTRFCLNA